jgi:DNA uptake protein ComE-like DNA-binding protein
LWIIVNPTPMKKDDLRQVIRDYFSLTASEKNGLILLCAILLVAILVNQFTDVIDFKKPARQEEFLALIEELNQQNKPVNTTEKRFFTFDPNTVTEAELDTLSIPSEIKNNLIHYREKGGSFRKPDDFKRLYGMTDSLFNQLKPFIRTNQKPNFSESGKGRHSNREFFAFDPNSITEMQLIKLGFTAFQTRNLLAFRNKGGKFRQKSDVLKIFGMDSLFYREIYDWMVINQTPVIIAEEKAKPLIELNATDSVELTSLPGIGPVFAGRILRYRQALGGFSTVDQLLEVYGMTPEKFRNLIGLVKADYSLITPIRLNFADYGSLNRHPYIDSRQAVRIIDWRSAHGAFTKKEVLLENGFFDENTFRKLEFYLTCQ